MNITISGKNIKVTDGIRNKIEEKIGKLSKYLDENDSVEVVVEATKKYHKIKVLVPVKDKLVKAEVKDDDLYAAIDRVEDIAKRQLRKYKDRKCKHRYGEKAEDIETEETFSETSVIKEKEISATVMTKEEAALQMEMLGHDFFLFKEESGCISVIYNRKDGEKGLIRVR